MQLIEVCCLPHGLLTLHQEHIGIVTGDECRFQEVLFLVWLVLKDIDGELDELVAMGRIDIAGIQQGVADQFDAPTFARQTVDTTEFGGIGNAFLFHSFAGTHRHAVVLCENEIDMAEITLIVFNCHVAALLCPVSLESVCQLYLWKTVDSLDKTVMPLNGRGGVFESFDLQYAAFSMKLMCDILSHGFSHLIVVGTDESCVFLGVGLAFEDNDGNTLVIGTVDGRGDGLYLVRSYNQQIDICLNKTVNLLHLSLIAIVGRGETHLYVPLDIGSHTQLRILLVTPDITGALGDADDMPWWLLATTGDDQ